MAVHIERILFTSEQYEKMIEAGILEEGDNVELLRGEIVKMACMPTCPAPVTE